MSANTFNWKRNALRHFLIHLVDMSIAIAGFIYGFGIEVKSWPAVIGLMLVSRWFTSVIAGMSYYFDAKQQAQEQVEADHA